MQPRDLLRINLPDPSTEFQEIFHSWLNLCQFTEEEKLGICFFMGLYFPREIMTPHKDPQTVWKQMRAISIFSKSSLDSDDYEEVDHPYIIECLYNVNLLISFILKDEIPFDQYLERHAPFPGDILAIKGDVNEAFINKYKDCKDNINNFQNLFDEFFTQIGTHLRSFNYSCERAYEAGVSFIAHWPPYGFTGFYFYIDTIYELLPPLFKALYDAPLFFVEDQEKFQKTHLFSLTLGHFYKTSYKNLQKVSKNIHLYHSYTFYNGENATFGKNWLFTTDSEMGSAIKVISHAVRIKKMDFLLPEDKQEVKDYLYAKGLYGSNISFHDFTVNILDVLEEKHGIIGHEEFLDISGGKWNNGYNHKGDYIQFLAILFYEACLHALVTKSINLE